MAKTPEDFQRFFDGFNKYRSCALIQTLPYEERCYFVKTTPDCQVYKIINYIDLLYCKMRPTQDITQILSVALLMTICLLLYMILGCTVDKVFCPALKVVARVLGLNEHMAGVTLLAMGNGSPDIVSTFAGGDISLSDIYGASLYVTTAVTAVIFLIQPLKLQASHILRDILFFMLSCLTVEYVMVSENRVTLIESIVILSIYISYLVVLISDQVLVKMTLYALEKRIMTEKYHTVDNFTRLDRLRSEAFIEIVGRSSRNSIDVQLTRNASYSFFSNKNDKLFDQLFESLNPIDTTEWNEAGLFLKMYIILKAPVLFVLALFIPIVDFELDRHGWSKLLNCLQISYFPVVFILVAFGDSWRIYDVPVYFYTPFFTIPISVYVFVTTRTCIPPFYNVVFCIYSMSGSVLIIYSIATEAVNILEVLGIVFHCSIPFLNCTLQAWGNGIGDLVSAITLSTHGYPRMAFAACIGGPFFNSIMSLGGTSLYKMLINPFHTQNVSVSAGNLGDNCVIFLLLALTSVLVWSLTNDFYGRRSIGIFNIILYALFFVFAILGESELIETFAPESDPLTKII